MVSWIAAMLMTLLSLGVALAALYLVRDLGSRVGRLEHELRALRRAHEPRAAPGADPSAVAGTPAAAAVPGAASFAPAPAASGTPGDAASARAARAGGDDFAAITPDAGRQSTTGAHAPRTAAPAPVHGPDNAADADRPRASDPAPRPPPASRSTRAPFTEAGSDTVPGALRRFFAGGNWLVSGGIVLLFLGVGFLLKFAVDNLHFPPAWRLAAAGLGGVALVAIGLRLVARRRAYALALQGGGVGLLYLSLYAAFRLYGLLPAGAAFMLMGMVVVAAGWLAVRQDALALAVLGAVGGFAAPLLASTGAGSHVLLFGYYAVLNAGVLGIAYFRAWRALNLVGFAATFVVGGLWGHRYYEPAYLASVEPFLVLFFAMYLGVAILFALRRSLHLRDPMDATLVFATPLVCFGLQSRLLADTAHGLALSALLLAAIYTLCAVLLWRRVGTRVGVLVEAFAALAVGFATVAVALAFDARWTSASWALEGAALVWVGWRQRRVLVRLAGAALQVGAGGVWAWQVLVPGTFATGDWLGTVMLAAAGLLSGAVLARAEDGGDERVLSVVLGLWGLLWWCGGGVLQLHAQLAPAALSGALLLFFAASALALEFAGARVRWALPRGAALLLPWVLCAIALAQVFDDAHPLVSLAAPAWPLALVAAALVLRRHDAAPAIAVRAGHALGLWLLAALAAWELAWWFREWLPPVSSWLRLAWLLAPAALVALVSWRARRAGPWPLDVHARLYLTTGCGPLVVVLAGGVFALGVGDPDGPWPVLYLPLLNPLDLGLAACFAAGVLWYRSAAALLGQGARNLCVLAGVMLAFVCVNGVLLRTLHLWADVPYRFSPMFHSTLVQASLSLLWVLTGLVTMVGASRAASRAAWAAGAALMGCVVVKLMLVDLANSATVARIVSFISVGLIMMLVGYLAPVPPRRAAPPCADGSLRGATSPAST
jgi:uncharacterized membrane protein